MKIRKNMPIISTDELDDVRAFYTKHFGFKVTFDCPGIRIKLWSRILNGA